MYRAIFLLLCIAIPCWGSDTVLPNHDPIAETLAERYRPTGDFIDDLRRYDVIDAEKLIRDAHIMVLSEALNPYSTCFEEMLAILHSKSLELRHMFKVRAITRAHLREYRRIHEKVRKLWPWRLE